MRLPSSAMIGVSAERDMYFGLRHEARTNISDLRDCAPRFAVAQAPSAIVKGQPNR